MLLSWVVYLLMVNTNYRFSRRVAHAGGYYAIGGHGMGGFYGFMNGWVYLLDETVIAINEDKCIKCEFCVIGCPTGAISAEWFHAKL